MIPITVHPFADKRFRSTRWGEEAEMRTVEAEEILAGPMPSSWQELSNRASALYLSELTEQALEVAYKALAQERTVPTLVNMAVILETLGRFEEALDYAREAAIIDPGDNRAAALYGESLLRMGRFAEGWPLYATERGSHGWLSPYVREWQGAHQDLQGKRILVIEGGGYGDNIYFLRWLNVLRKWGAIIEYVCQPSFAPLVRECGYTAIENWAGNVDLDDSYDYFTSVLSLAWKLGVTLENYRWTGPYIPGRHWWKRSGAPRVGLCWRAGEGRSPRKQRSLSDPQLRLVAYALPQNFQWVNLSFNPNTPVEMIWPDIKNWLDTADTLATLDLLVSVDTGVAHLGGAMGVPTLVMLPGAAAWQYPLGHEYHPLYPSMRIFRNAGEGLDQAVENVSAVLEGL